MDPHPFAAPPLPPDLHSTLEAVADATLLVDNHAHPFWLPDPRNPSSFVIPHLADVLTEAAPHPHPSAAASHPHVDAPVPTPSPLAPRATLAFCRALRDLHALVASESEHGPSPQSSCGPDTTTDDHHHNHNNRAAPSASAHTCEHGLDAPADSERTIEAMRAEMGPWNLAKRCFAAAGIAAVLIDDGLACPRGAIPVTLPDFPARLNVPIARRVLRLETEAELVLAELVLANDHHLWQRPPRPPPGFHHSPDKRPRTTLRAQLFRNAFRARLDPLPADVVSFKSIAAYRSGLDIRLDWSDGDLEDALSRMSFSNITSPSSSGHDRPTVRLEDTVIIDCVVRAGLEAARLHSIPLQFHCGFGDTDLHLPNANPVLLRSIFQQFPDVNIVLLHGAWPFTRQAAYLTSVYPAVYLDIGLAIPLLSARGMFRLVDEALEIAPITKVLYSSDAHSVPDVFFLAARWGRRIVAAVIAASVASGDLGQAEAKAAIRKILAENAIKLYNLPVNTDSAEQ